VDHLGPLSYLVETTNSDLWRSHVDMLKELGISNDSPAALTPPFSAKPRVIPLTNHPQVMCLELTLEPADSRTSRDIGTLEPTVVVAPPASSGDSSLPAVVQPMQPISSELPVPTHSSNSNSTTYTCEKTIVSTTEPSTSKLL